MTHHLILTQSTPPSSDDSQKFRDMGFTVTHIPALTITYINTPLNCPFKPETLIITSKHSLHNIEDYNFPSNINILCVGDSVKNYMLEKGLKNITGVFETGTHLINEIKNAPTSYKNILYLRGKNVQHDILGTCKSLNLNIHEHITYQSNTNANLQENLQNALTKNEQVTICIFSEKGAKAIAKSITEAQHTPQERRTNLLCLSQRMLNSLEQFKWRRTLVCTRPTKQNFLLKINNLKDTGKNL